MAEPETRFVATARKYRPQRFVEIVAQPGVTVTLQNALATGRLHHAYLFAGPRGTGKTTTARILAKALNCRTPEGGEPCGTCEPCSIFAAGRSLDVIEIDGASNRGVDDIRNLRERVAYAAAGGGYKVYIVDEVHMLTHEAFNALLKTLEEPPPKVIFIFATTEPGKVPPTILSRCQRFDFRRITPSAVQKAIEHVAEAENIAIDAGATELLAQRASGSLRDAFSLLDQVAAFGQDRIDRALVEQALGVVSEAALFTLTELWARRETERAFTLLAELWEGGIDPAEWAAAFGEHLRSLLAAKVGGAASPGDRFEHAAAPFALGDLLRAQVMLSDLKLRLRVLGDARPEVELFVLRLFTLADTVSLAEVLGGRITERPPPRAREGPAPPGPARDSDPTDAPMLNLTVAEPGDDQLPSDLWQRFLVLLRRKAPWAASELRRGTLETHDHRRAQFFVPDTNPFNQERLGSAGIQGAIAEAFAAVYGGRPKIAFRFGDLKSAPADRQSLMEAHPDLAHLIAATDGEIVARRPRN